MTTNTNNAHDVTAAAMRCAWLGAIVELGNAMAARDATTGPDADDHAMRDAHDDELIAWVDDLEARVGLCVGEFRAAVLDYIAMRAVRVLQQAGATVTPHPVAGMGVVVDGALFADAMSARDALHAGFFYSNNDDGTAARMVFDRHEFAARVALSDVSLPEGYTRQPADIRGFHTGGHEVVCNTAGWSIGIYAAEDDRNDGTVTGWVIWEYGDDGDDVPEVTLGALLNKDARNRAAAHVAQRIAAHASR